MLSPASGDALQTATDELFRYLCENPQLAGATPKGYNWFAAENGKERIDSEGHDVHPRGRVEQLLEHPTLVMGRTPGVTLHRPTLNPHIDHCDGTHCEPKA
jgi:hypothetical protein